MKKLLLISTTLIISLTSLGQDEVEVKKQAAKTKATSKEFKEGWTRGGFFNINGSNVIFQNWAAGGSGQTGIVANASLFAVKRNGNGLWENYLDLAYGLIRNGGAKTDDPTGALDANGNVLQVTNPFVKSEDRFVFQTKYGRRINKRLNYAALFNFNTQMFPAFEADDKFRQELYIADFASQAFGFASIGIDYKPTSYLSVFFSPITMKYTYVNNLRLTERYGNDSLSRLRAEMGWYLNTQISKDIMKNIKWNSRLELFNSYDAEYVFNRIDINWQNTINMKVNKYITVSLITQLIYDDDVDINSEQAGKQMAAQWKHFTGIGFAYKFGDEL